MRNRSTQSKNITPLCGILLAAAAFAGSAHGQTLTTIQDTLFRADGSRFSGSLNIHWVTFDSSSTGTIVQQSRTVTVINGNLQVQLVPNAGVPTPANVYTVQYQSDGREQFTELWTVPVSVTPLKVADVRTATVTGSGSGSGSGGGSVGNTAPIPESNVVGLVSDLGQRPVKGPEFATGSVAVINQNGQIDTAIGNIGDCVFVDGTTGPCGGPSPLWADAEVPGGLVDGVNDTFTLLNPPSGASLLLFRNGLYMTAALDYTLNGSTITFAPAAIPQPLDTLAASYRIDPASNVGNLSLGPHTSVLAQVLCSANGLTNNRSSFASLGACDIPAVGLKPGDRIEIRFTFSHTGTASGFNVQVNWGNIAILNRHGSAQDSAFVGQAEASVTSAGSQVTVQSWGTVLPFLPAIVSAGPQNGVKVDLLGDVSTEGSDTIALTNFTVLRYPAI